MSASLVVSCFALVYRADRRTTIRVFALVLLTTLCGGAFAFGVRNAVNAAVAREVGAAVAAAFLAAGAQAVNLVLTRTQGNYQMSLSEHVAIAVDRDVLTASSAIPGIEHFERREYLDRLALVVGKGRDVAGATWTVINGASLAVRLLLAVVLLATVHVSLALLPLAAVPALLLARKGQAIVGRTEQSSAYMFRLYGHLNRSFLEPAAAKELRAQGLGHMLDRRAARVWRDLATRLASAGVQSTLLGGTGWALFSVATAAAVAWTARRAIGGGASVGEAVLVAQVAMQLRGQVASVSTTATSVAGALRTMQRLTWLRDYQRETMTRYQGKEVAPGLLLEGLQVSGISFTYPGTTARVLNDVSFVVPAGSTVALVGENGAGKTTLVKLLARFYDPDDGSIALDGVPLDSFDPASLRLATSATFQDFAKLETAARESVGAGWLALVDDDAALHDAFRKAAAADLPPQWPDSLDSHLGLTYRSGSELSTGEWQKVAVARSMVKPAPLLLILDEPTASLDAGSEADLLDHYAASALETRERGGITFVISHRFSTVRAADMILVLEEGRLVEQGTHDELMGARGRYADLYERQASSYR